MFGGCGQERPAIHLKIYPLPFSSLLSSSMLSSSAFILSSLFPYPALSSIHCQEGPCQKGPISVSWQRQRLAAPAASTVSLDFVSGTRGLGRAVHTQTDSLQTLERNFHGLGLLPTSPSLPPWKFPAKAIDVLGMSHGEEAWWGVEGP